MKKSREKEKMEENKYKEPKIIYKDANDEKLRISDKNRYAIINEFKDFSGRKYSSVIAECRIIED